MKMKKTRILSVWRQYMHHQILPSGCAQDIWGGTPTMILSHPIQVTHSLVPCVLIFHKKPSTHDIAFCCLAAFVCPTLPLPHRDHCWKLVGFDALSMPMNWCMSYQFSVWVGVVTMLVVPIDAVAGSVFFLLCSNFLFVVVNHVVTSIPVAPPDAGMAEGGGTWGLSEVLLPIMLH